MVAPARAFSQSFTAGLDELLYMVCEELQLTAARYDLAVERYNTLNRVLESPQSPFRYLAPQIYPQGSMALGTTVKPIDGPHDLDFVLQLSQDHRLVDPMALIQRLYEFLHQHGTYGSMVTLKNRCVRIAYTDDFYMDILPACLNTVAGGTCIKVPDRQVKGWRDSNPRGYLAWFEEQGSVLLVDQLLHKAEPIPDQQAVTEKNALQLVVQLMKRWRDLYYADSELAPISIVLTTLAADRYSGEQSVSEALASVLNGIVNLIDESDRDGKRPLRVVNPSNHAENLSERWDANPEAYSSFEVGLREFRAQWLALVSRGGNVNAELEAIFGEPVKTVVKKRAQRLQESRTRGTLGVTSSGLITPMIAGITKAQPNTFYGEE